MILNKFILLQIYTMYIYIIIILILFALLAYGISKRNEKFCPTGIDRVIGVVGHEEELPDEYRFVDYNILKKPLNQKDLAANISELRYPSLIHQRYSYDDKRNSLIKYYDLNNFARLKELPIGFNPYMHKTEPIVSNSNCHMTKHLNGFDYNNANRITFNAGPGTSDSFYLEDKGF